MGTSFSEVGGEWAAGCGPGGSGPSVAFVTSLLAQSVGGTVSAMLGLGRALVGQGWSVVLHHVLPSDPQDEVGLITPIQARAHPCLWRAGLAVSGPMRRELARDRAEGAVYHAHGLWTMPGHYAAAGARRMGKPLVWTTHNMLQPGYLAWHGWRKRAFLGAFGRRDLGSAACLHALTPAELADIRRCGLRNPVAVVPNGTELPGAVSREAIEGLEGDFSDLRGKKLVLFLGRIHPQKGLEHLIQGWARVAGQFAGWQIVVAGPDEAGYRRRFENLAAESGVGERVTFVGPLAGVRKDAALQRAEFFVLPSFSEGFSSAVLEALAAGKPVLMTPGCSFGEAVACSAALLAEPRADAWAEGLREMMLLSDERRREMGRCGRRLVESGYTWVQVAAKMIAVYRWVLGEAPVPGFVEGA